MSNKTEVPPYASLYRDIIDFYIHSWQTEQTPWPKAEPEVKPQISDERPDSNLKINSAFFPILAYSPSTITFLHHSTLYSYDLCNWKGVL